jgi:histone H3/H4
MLIVKSKIKEMVGEINVGGDFADALNAKAEQLVKDAVKRAEANSRRTIMAKDV